MFERLITFGSGSVMLTAAPLVENDTSPFSIALAALGTLGVLFGAYVSYMKARSERRFSISQQWKSLYNESVTENAKLETQIENQRQEFQHSIEKVNSRIDASVRRERIRDDYIQILRQHIADGKPPPPPPWPQELT